MQDKLQRNSLLIGIILVGVVGGYLVLKNNTTVRQLATTSKQSIAKVIPNLSPTPYPFRELTIPALRERKYTSELGELTPSYEESNYTAYLTSYDSDGLKINGLLTQPKGDRPEGGWPAIIFIHGYIPPAQYQTTQQYYNYVDYLARNGFVVFKIDLRGHGDSQGEPSGAYYSADYVIDTLNAYAALQSSDFVNQKRIGLWGHSMAGNVVMRSVAVNPTIPAVNIWAGAVYSYEDQRKYGISDSSYQPLQNPRRNIRQQLNAAHGEQNNSDIFWQELAPTTYLNDLKGAIQINHAIDDAVVNIGYSRDLMALLDNTDVIHVLHEYDSGGHNISGSAFTQSMEDTVTFYTTYLK